MATEKITWSVCPVEDCVFALEFDPSENYFCPTCDMEMISECPSCRTRIQTEDQSICRQCSTRIKV